MPTPRLFDLTQNRSTSLLKAKSPFQEWRRNASPARFPPPAGRNGRLPLQARRSHCRRRSDKQRLSDCARRPEGFRSWPRPHGSVRRAAWRAPEGRARNHRRKPAQRGGHPARCRCCSPGRASVPSRLRRGRPNSNDLRGRYRDLRQKGNKAGIGSCCSLGVSSGSASTNRGGCC